MRVGSRWKSTVDSTEVMVIRGPSGDVDLRCGGHPMVTTLGSGGSPLDPAFADGTQVGKRYTDESIGLEVLCSKGGQGTLAVADRPLALREAKPLPTSD